jgi:hypothetical protein
MLGAFDVSSIVFGVSSIVSFGGREVLGVTVGVVKRAEEVKWTVFIPLTPVFPNATLGSLVPAS